MVSLSARSLRWLLIALSLAAAPACVADGDVTTAEQEAENNTAAPENNTAAPENNTAAPENNTAAPENNTAVPENNGGQEFYDQSTELAFPDAPTDAVDAWYAGREVTLQQVDGAFVFEGDILLPDHMVTFDETKLVFQSGEAPESHEAYNELTGRTKNHWPDGKVYYAVDPALPKQERVTDAIAHWEANTNLEFIERTDESAYVYFTPGGGCSSYVGMIGGKQNITLHDYCSTGNTIHEIGHAVGLWHEQSRADRDSWITIHWENIQTGRDYNFKTYAEAGWDGQELTGELDFDSIMMYSSYSFSANGQPTITKKDGSTFPVQRSALSPGDLDGLAALYPEDGGEPEYVNGEYYVIAGLTVLRYYDQWYYNMGYYGWKRVILVDGVWYFA